MKFQDLAPDRLLNSDSVPISRAELWVIVIVTLLAGTLRFAFPSGMAIEHFDEGVYASNLLFPDAGFQYPDRHLYAPSLVPALIEWSIIAFGDKGIAPMLPSLLFGTLTIPLIWWVGRQWFGPFAGIAAATLLSFSDFHIAFSRSALTDVPLCFWLLLAVYLFERAFRDLSRPAAIAAGVITGLAWWTKYNGWLPLAISLSGLMAWSLFARRDERQFLRRLSLWAISAATAIAIWSPYLLTLPHGYAEVARNHSQYLVGFSGWTTGLNRQLKAMMSFNSPVSWCGLAVLVVGWQLFDRESTMLRRLIANKVRSIAVSVVALALSAIALVGMLITTNQLLWVTASYDLLVMLVIAASSLSLTAVDAVGRWIQRRRPQASDVISNADLCSQLLHSYFRQSDWLAAAWIAGLTLSVPLYRSYPRLALPWLVSIILFLSSFWDARSHFEIDKLKSTFRTSRMVFLGITTSLLLCVRWSPVSDSFQFRCWETRSKFREIARDVTRDTLKAARAGNQRAIQNTQAVLYVYAEPGLFFHLPADRVAVQPAGNLNFVDIEATHKLPTFLVTGPHAQRSQTFADEFASRADHFELVASYPYDASDFVRLDEVSASQLRTRREPLAIHLYRVHPSRAAE